MAQRKLEWKQSYRGKTSGDSSTQVRVRLPVHSYVHSITGKFIKVWEFGTQVGTLSDLPLSLFIQKSRTFDDDDDIANDKKYECLVISSLKTNRYHAFKRCYYANSFILLFARQFLRRRRFSQHFNYSLFFCWKDGKRVPFKRASSRGTQSVLILGLIKGILVPRGYRIIRGEKWTLPRQRCCNVLKNYSKIDELMRHISWMKVRYKHKLRHNENVILAYDTAHRL